MKIVVVSDIHANLEAFRAVLDAERGFDGFLCLGDITGYGTEPAECVELARSVARKAAWSLVLAGNHDAVLTGKLSESWFNGAVLPSIAYTRSRLSMHELDWLASLPSSADVILPRASEMGAPARRLPLPHLFRKGSLAAIAAHGDPAAPLTGYLWGGTETASAYAAMERRGVGLCFVGHSHESSAFSRGGLGSVSAGGVLSIGENEPVIVNPGSVGFPRDFGLLARVVGDPSSISSPGTDGLLEPEPLSLERYPAYYAVWDSETGTVTFRNARYDRSDFERRVTVAGI